MNLTDPAANTNLASFDFHTHGIAGNTIAAFGLVGNILSIIVLSHPKIRSSTAYYLITLAIYDNLILLGMVFLFNLPTLAYRIPLMKTYSCHYKFAMRVLYPFCLTAQMGSIYTTVGFTIERYIAVCRPFEVSKMCTRARTKKTIGLILILVSLYNIPRYFEFEIKTNVNSNETGVSDACVNMAKTEFGISAYYSQVYLIYFQLFFMFLIPFIILVTLNVGLIKAVKQSRHNIQQISNTSRSNDNNLTIMLISVIIVFLICQLPSIVDNIIHALMYSVTFENTDFISKFYRVCTLMVEINSAVNFILYCVFGKKFRLTFQQIFGLKKLHINLQYRSVLNRSSVQMTNRENSNEII